MNVTASLATVLVAGAAIVIGCLVHRWTEPTPGAASSTSKGERLGWADAAAAAVIVIGAFLASGINIEAPAGLPASGPSGDLTPSPTLPDTRQK